jgi:hypothetical protein
VKSVELRVDTVPGAGHREWWHIVHDDTTRPGLHLMVIPADSMHWRAAEYDVDPADAETLLDIVTHEHLAPVHPDHPKFLYNTHVRAARDHYLAGIEAIRGLHGLTDPDGLLNQIRNHHRESVDHRQHTERTTQVKAMRTARIGALHRG